MAERPLIIFPTPRIVDVPKGHSGGKMPPKPVNSRSRIQRFEDKMTAALSYVSNIPVDSSAMLVIETIGKVQNFQNAVAKTYGLEWLAEFDIEDMEIAEDDYEKETDLTNAKKVGGRLYLISSNRSAIETILRLWKEYQRSGKLTRGYGVWKMMFTYLHDLRWWNEHDRLEETGIIERWRGEVAIKSEGVSDPIAFEVELHFRRSNSHSNSAEKRVTELVESMQGNIIKSIRIAEIGFHSLKVTLPVEQVSRLLQSIDEQDYLNLIKDDAIKFFRPIPQQLTHPGEPDDEATQIPELPSDQLPVIAMLDGMPIENHALLADRLIVDDPDAFARGYPPNKRSHGTSMASLICHADLNDPGQRSLTRKIYVRPIMQPYELPDREQIPDHHFPEDLVHRAVKRIFETEGDDTSTVSIRVINLSIGNLDIPFLGQMSSWARLLDWLAWEYKVLFIVSAGNYAEQITMPANETRYIDEAIRQMDTDIRNRKILSPAESMNALSIGAMHADYSEPPTNDERVDIMQGEKLVAPYSRFGAGYRGSCKPDILVAGGRQFFIKSHSEDQVIFSPDNRNVAPGQRNAFVGHNPEDIHNTAHTRGTSNSAALATHAAGEIYEVLQGLKSDTPDGKEIPEEYEALMLKALLVHGASWGSMDEFFNIIKKPEHKRFGRIISRHLGYGEADFSRVMECTAQRVTAIGFGKLSIKNRHRFELPVPSNCQNIDYRLIATLAYFTPINPFNFKYRAVKVFFDCPLAKGHRQEADWQQAQGGTVQHEIFDLNLISNEVEIEIQCNADADAKIDEEIPYALCLTLEARQNTSVDIYDAIWQDINLSAQVTE